MSETTWNTDRLVGFDTETTGIDTAHDRIVSAAIVDGADTANWLIDPGVEIPPAASRVHGITTERARAEGAAPAEALAEIAQALGKAAAEGVPVVVYRAGFDLTLLSHELDRHDLPQVPWAELRVVDPFVLDKKCDKYRKGKRTLSVVCEHYGVSLTDAHSAAADARAAVDLARAIGERHGQVRTMSAAELHNAQIGWHADDAAGLQEFFRRKGRDEVVDGRWPLQR
ncbi:MAG TPA: exonuclease domain-containing protein [Stackebrandtia sp.]|jgi:DNA polymerase-3 subunit epsilon|uniref:exonuclease domain-containing protein n=1 Tax=Stackebrandtia sp. TaxID=2023065 RepID=UPI002D6F10FA|nr:exonuclease domain-containing protein [Stackebrandtia sp.]HZE42016.1 exonuclease domain-containing protein [Stackebrandtia sp.]